MASLFVCSWLSRRIRERHEDGKIGIGQHGNSHFFYFLSAFVAMKKKSFATKDTKIEKLTL
jgi:hypothetical protein